MSELDILPLTGVLGAEIRGVDLGKPVDTALREQIEAALLEHQVLFFPRQDMSAADHVALGRGFGELQTDHAPYLKVDPEHPEVIIIETTHEGASSLDRANVWHTDVTWQERPPTGSILHMQEIPEAGGDTLWVSLGAAYEALSEPMRNFLDPLRAVHDMAHTILRYGIELGAPREPVLEFAKQVPAAEHPVVRTHPRTGRKGLFVNPTFTSHIAGLPLKESDAILAFLYAHMVQPEFSVRRRWSQGDVGLWDNRCTAHYAVNDYGFARRCIRRVTILGEQPV